MTIKNINNKVSKIALILKKIYEVTFLLFVLYTVCNPFIKAYKPFPAAHIVKIIEIDIVPKDFE